MCRFTLKNIILFSFICCNFNFANAGAPDVPSDMPAAEHYDDINFSENLNLQRKADEKLLKEFNITSILIVGNSVLSKKYVDAVLEDFVGKEITKKRLDNIRAAIFDAYTNKGYLATVELPVQKFKDGVVRAQVTELKLGNVYTAEEDKVRFNEKKARKYIEVLSGDVLSINELDKQVKLLDSLPGILAETKIRPVPKGDEVDVDLFLGNTDVFEAVFQVDNLGAKSTGRRRYTGNVQLNSLFSQGEKIVLGGDTF